MRVTYLGHAGLFVETDRGSVLCDPWFNPAFLASWFPFPSNEEIDPRTIGSPDYLFVSHLHQDHLDARFLREHVSKSATVILPDFPTDHLRRTLSDLGFRHFVNTINREALELDGLRIMVNALITPTDGPIGDSGIAIDDGRSRIFDQNDSRPVDIEALIDFGPYDAHFLQFSGGIWYPMVYEFPAEKKRALGKSKRSNELGRAMRFAKDVGATHVFPCAGPPCFLDEDLFWFNDTCNDDANIFPDQTVFLAKMREGGMDNGHLVVPGTVITLEGGGCELGHPLPDDEIRAIFTDKRAYLESYRARHKAEIEAEKACWPVGRYDLLATLKGWWEPLIAAADHTCAGVNGRVLLRIGDEEIVLDFLDRRVERWNGESCRYQFSFERGPVEACIERGEEDWVNALFLSCRFKAERDGPYNEYVYTFFKSLSVERMQYVEGYYSERSPVQETWECEGYLIQRRCPHLKADLTRFGQVEDGVLTCQLHGWQFDLATGRCLTSDDRRLQSVPLPEQGTDPR
jgi:UDP-MurNAc hydroxylase